jgi:Predicted membrane protein (DUF2207)
VTGRRVRSWLGLAAVAAALLLATPARAQSQETIHRYVVRIVILADGDLRITERIDYDFGADRRHGIFRTIPSRFSFDEVNDRVYPIEDVSVSSPTAPTDVDVSREGTSTVIRVGDEDVEISGRHEYTLVYRVEGALNAFADHDQLYWNAIGHEWEAPIEEARVVVVAPAAIRRVSCYQGYQGSVEKCGRASSSGPNGRFAAGRELAPLEGMTVVVALRKGAVAPVPEPILEERWAPQRAFSVTPGTIGVSLAVAALLAGASSGLRSIR